LTSARLVVIAVTICTLPAIAFQKAESELAKQARTELFAGRYGPAALVYRKLATEEPHGDAYYQLTRVLLEDHKTRDAYTVAEEALKQAPQTPGTQTAAGMVAYRKGNFVEAETYFRAALKLDPNFCGANSELASLSATFSKSKTARALFQRAYAACPDDPASRLGQANYLKGAEHIAALEKALMLLDPESEDAHSLRVHVAHDRAIGDRKTRRLISPYESTRVHLAKIGVSNRDFRGFGLRVQFNQHQTFTLLLDTGASGISLTPKLAQKVGLELLGEEQTETKGIGDKKPQSSSFFLASEVRIGNVVFADHPVKAFRSAKDSDVDGLIGPDVFARFVVALDFPGLQMDLTPYAIMPGDDPEDASPLATGFGRVVRSGTHLCIATAVNQKAVKWFLIDSGASSNLIDTESAREFTGVHRDSSTVLRGVQGAVNQVSRADHISLAFAGFHQDNADLIAINLDDMSDGLGFAISGVIGKPILQFLKLTIDYRAGAVRFERPPN
jgi:predicted aspartyl protease